MLNSEVWNAILPETTTYEECRQFRNRLHNAYEHRTSEYPVIIRGWGSFYMSFFKYIFNLGQSDLFNDLYLELANVWLFFVYSPKPQKGDCGLSNFIKETHAKNRDKSADMDRFRRIESFFKSLYNLACANGCEFNKRSDWAVFFNDLPIEDVLEIFKSHGFSRPSETFDMDEESPKTIENDDDLAEEEYIYDELQEDYIKLISQNMPHIKSVEDFDGIFWSNLTYDFAKLGKCHSKGLLETSLHSLKYDFVKLEFGKNLELDAHVFYNTGFSILQALCMDDLVDKILDLIRDILTADKKAQDKMIAANKLDLTEDDFKLLKFFYKDLTDYVKESLEVLVSMHEKIHGVRKNEYGAAFFFQQHMFENKCILLSLKDSVIDMLPSSLL